MGDLKADLRETRRLLALYKERLSLLDTRNPALALVATAQVGEYDRYRSHFTRKIWQLDYDVQLMEAKLGMEYYQQQWREMGDYEREASFLPDQMLDLEDIIQELEGRGHSGNPLVG